MNCLYNFVLKKVLEYLSNVIHAVTTSDVSYNILSLICCTKDLIQDSTIIESFGKVSSTLFFRLHITNSKRDKGTKNSFSKNIN